MRYRVKKSIHFERVTGGGPLGLDTSVSNLMPISSTGVPSIASNSLHHWFKSNPASKRECKAQTAKQSNVLRFSRKALLMGAGRAEKGSKMNFAMEPEKVPGTRGNIAGRYTSRSTRTIFMEGE